MSGYRDDRVPVDRARYYNYESFGGSDNRGQVCQLRILNVKKDKSGGIILPKSVQKLGPVEQSVYKELAGDGYTSFLIQSIQFQDTEKASVVHTFGDGEVVYFLGRNPRMINISGVLLDNLDSNWFYKFMVAYDKFLRGTRLAKSFQIIALTFANIEAVGCIMDMSYNQNSANDSLINFSFSFLVKSMEPVSAYDAAASVGNYSNTNSLGNVNLSEIPTLSAADVNKSLQLTVNQPGVVNDNVKTVSLQITPSFSQGDLYARINPATGEAALLTDGQMFKKPVTLWGSDDQPKKTNSFAAKVSKVYNTSLAAAKKAVSSVSNFLKKITSGLSYITNFMNNVASLANSLASGIAAAGNALTQNLRDILAPVNQLISSTNNALDSIKGVVTTLNTQIDHLLLPLQTLSEDISLLRDNFEQTRGMVLSLPEDISSKVSRMVLGAKLTSGGSVGSLTYNITSEEALAVLSITNTTTTESLGSLNRGYNTTDTSDTSKTPLL